MNKFQLAAQRLTACFVFSGLIISSACALHAGVLPIDYTAAQAYLFDGLGTVSCLETTAIHAACSTFDSHASALVADGHGGSASVAIGDSGGTGYAVTAYAFGLFGPKTENVPILINGFAATVDGKPIDAYGYASYVTYEYTDSTVKWADNYVASSNGCGYISGFSNAPCQADGDFTLNSSVQSNSVFVVVFQAVAIGADSSAFIDPTITVDPSFSDAGLFMLVSGPGVFAAVPEPLYGPVLTIMGVVSAACRWRRNSAQIATSGRLRQTYAESSRRRSFRSLLG